MTDTQNTPSGTPEEAQIDPAKLRRSRLSFLALVAIAAAPVIAAYAMYFFMPDLAPETRSNEGQLVQPVVELGTLGGEAPNLAGKWTLLVPIQASACDEQCQQTLYLARQVNVALGKESTRVQHALLQAQPRLDDDFFSLIATEYPNLKRRVVPAEAFATLEVAAGAPAIDGHIFLSDPNGNVMMVYTKEQEGRALIDDLKKLLRLSNIG